MSRWKFAMCCGVLDDQDKYGQFYGGDCYVMLYTYLVSGKESFLIYFWQVSVVVSVGFASNNRTNTHTRPSCVLYPVVFCFLRTLKERKNTGIFRSCVWVGKGECGAFIQQCCRQTVGRV